MSYNINDVGGFTNFLTYVANTNSLVYFKEKEEGVLVPIPFAEFEDLNDLEKQKVYEKLEGVVKKIQQPPIPPAENEELSHDSPFTTAEEFPIPSDQTLSKIIQARNAIFYSLHKPPKETSIPKEIMGHLQSFTTPKDIQSTSSVSKTWGEGGPDARAHTINQGIALKNAIPPQIGTTKEAIEWLKKNVNCKALTYADLRGFQDLDDNNLKELIELCPNLSHLLIRSNKITKIEMLPAGLQELFCSECPNLNQLSALPAALQRLYCGGCSNLNQLPALPAALQELNCRGCDNLNQLPALSAALQRLDCTRCSHLNQLPALSATLQELFCSECPNLNQLPALPATLQRLYCYECPNLNQLPALPDALQNLNCDQCPLNQLPALPDGLQGLTCSWCRNLNQLPALPAALQVLSCSGCDNLNQLPALPAALKELDCSGCDNLNQLPALSAALQELFCSECPNLNQESKDRAEAFLRKNG